jgi:hypothetical protein
LKIYQKTSIDPSVRQQIQPGSFLLLLVLACLLEVFCLGIVALSPLPALRLSETPLVYVWRWTLVPSHLLLTVAAPLLYTSTLLPPLLLGLIFIGMIAIYAWAILLVRRVPAVRWPWFWLLLGATLLFGVTLLFQPRLFSDDVFTYMFSGRILAIYKADPMNTIPLQFPNDPYLVWVINGPKTTNIFGPLWLSIAALLASVSNSPVISLLLFKGLALLTHLLNCCLVWAILAKISPQRQIQGTLLYAWNPLILIELPGSGHSEGVLLTLLLLVVWLHLQGSKPFFHICSLLVFGLAISTNLIALLLAPLYLWFVVRTQHPMSRMLRAFTWRLLVLLLPFVAIMLPYWRGPSTFFAITSAIDMGHFVHSPAGLLVLPLRWLFQSVAQWWHFPSFLQPITAADMTLRSSATLIFTLIYLQIFDQVQRAPSTIAAMKANPASDQEIVIPGFDALLYGWTRAIFWYLILVSGWFWPWYVLWMFWIVVLRRLDTFTVTILLLACTTLFIYPFVGFSRAPLATYQAALIFGIPLVYLIIAHIRQRRGRVQANGRVQDPPLPSY